MRFRGDDYCRQYARFRGSRSHLAEFRTNLRQLLCDDFRLAPEAACSVASALYSRMDDPRLHYHTPLHILSMLAWAADNRVELEPWLELAVWFHDAVYDPLAANGTNERRSESLMKAMLDGHVAPAVLDRVGSAIRATSRHLERQVEAESALLLDLDLCNFAWDRANFAASSQDLADELIPLVGAEQFRTGRRQFLTDLLARGFVFRTAPIRAAHEQAARRNIEQLLADELAR